jgi:peptidoglycan hydrolase-like protein with peptidoglycan-binding domain
MMPYKPIKLDVFTLSILGALAMATLSSGTNIQFATATPKQTTAVTKTSTPAAVSPKQTSSSTHPTLRMGATGQAVKDLQSALKKAGFYEGPIDGGFGAQTKSAVIKFQQSKKKMSDGVVGPQTWALL